MKSHELHQAVLIDVYNSVGLSHDRDVQRLVKRASSEGRHFLDITLPTLDDLLLEGLSKGLLPNSVGWAMKRCKPKFLFPLWDRIFDDAGIVLSEPCIESIRGIRQISRLSKKVFEVCSPSLVESAISRFVELDASLADSEIFSTLPDIAFILFKDIIHNVSEETILDFVKHGPGAVAEGSDSVSKFEFSSVSPQIESVFGPETFRPFWAWGLEDPPKTAVTPARLCAVPKTALKPRLISIEPSYNQYIQQGIHSILKRGIGSMAICQYDSAYPNWELARRGSIDGTLSTIDLSDASDRVSLRLFEHVFSRFPRFVALCNASRSATVDTGHGVILLKKFASMGSAVTFPVEALVFTAILILSVMEHDGLGLSSVRAIARRPELRVYGDDIIVPTIYCPKLFENLEKFGLKVNLDKSFFSGSFRESCGMDFYAGVQVQPVYQRRHLPQNRHHVEEIISLSSFRDRFLRIYGEGAVTSLVDDLLNRVLGFYPWHSDPPRSNSVSRRGKSKTRWNRDLQRHETSVWVQSSKRRLTPASDYAKLFASLSWVGSDEPPDLDRVTHGARPYAAKLKRRWVEEY